MRVQLTSLLLISPGLCDKESNNVKFTYIREGIPEVGVLGIAVCKGLEVRLKQKVKIIVCYQTGAENNNMRMFKAMLE